MSKKALVVDNDYFFVEFLSELLENRGYSVTKAYDGKEGICRLEEAPVDIVFADLLLPKVDTRQFIEFIRIKYQNNYLPIVALSGAVIEQLSVLDEIGADFYIPKGPINKLAVQLNQFMAEIETRSSFPPTGKKIIENANIFPRREAVELINFLKFHKAVIENIGVGVITVDRDTRILNANFLALAIMGKSIVDILNCPVADLFPSKEKSELKGALKRVIREPDTQKVVFYTTFNDQIIRAIVSPIILDEDHAGWIVALEDSDQRGPKAISLNA